MLDSVSLLKGQGQHVDVALFDVQVAYNGYRAQDYLDSGVVLPIVTSRSHGFRADYSFHFQVPKRLGNSHPNIVPYNSFPTSDGYIIIAVGNDSQFRSCCEVLGIPAIGSDERFKTNPLRVKNRIELTKLIGEITQTKSTTHWVGVLSDNGNVPHSPINTIDKVFEDDQVRPPLFSSSSPRAEQTLLRKVKAREMVVNVPHALLPETGVKVIANPLKLSATPITYGASAAQRRIPTLGSDTRDVLRSVLAFEDAAIDELISKKIIS